MGSGSLSQAVLSACSPIIYFCCSPAILPYRHAAIDTPPSLSCLVIVRVYSRHAVAVSRVP